MSRQQKPRLGFAFPAKKPTMDQILANARELSRTSTDFLKADVETALTFVRIARQSKGDDPKRRRNQKNARRGYETILRFINRVTLDVSDADHMSRKLQLLKAELQELGETI
jgi:hypothetical protein